MKLLSISFLFFCNNLILNSALLFISFAFIFLGHVPISLAGPRIEGVTPQTASEQPTIFYGLQQLPPPVRKTALQIYQAARLGDLQAMREILEMNELKPMVADRYVSDIIAHWKVRSVDGSGLDILAKLVAILRAGYIKVKNDRYDTLYLWPYFAGIPLNSLTGRQRVELYQLEPAAKAAAMLKTGRYTGARLGIGGDGTWHFFLQPKPRPANRDENNRD